MNEEELFKKAKSADSPEELLRLARENGMPEFTEENAKIYFDVLNKSGELSDEEIDVSAAGCAVRSHGQKMVSLLNKCDHWVCNRCNGVESNSHSPKETYIEEWFARPCQCEIGPALKMWAEFYGVRKPKPDDFCSSCYYCSYERGAWWCNNKPHYNE